MKDILKFNHKIIIYGAGEHGRIVLDVLCQKGIEVSCFIDDTSKLSEFEGIPVLPSLDSSITFLSSKNLNIFLGLGRISSRQRILSILEDHKIETPSLTSPSALISKATNIGSASFIGNRAIVNTGSNIGKGCIVNSAAVIEHDCNVGDYTEISVGVLLGGGTSIKEECFIGIGAVIRDHVSIGRGSIIGMGSVVVKDIPAGVVAYGSPARVIRKTDK